MNDSRPILKDITRLTGNIETNYPELYRFLDEFLTTIPSYANPLFDKETLEEYLGNLKELLRRHIQTHKISTNENV